VTCFANVILKLHIVELQDPSRIWWYFDDQEKSGVGRSALSNSTNIDKTYTDTSRGDVFHTLSLSYQDNHTLRFGATGMLYYNRSSDCFPNAVAYNRTVNL
jgi:hypothetical protein